jgi:glycosyltransferase involved in cell wall biosynthesis
MPVLQSLVVELDIEQYVVLMGWVGSTAEVARYLDSMDICVAPEPSDPYNNRSTAIKIMEYMAAGKPIVSSDLPEHNFTAREAAIYARPNDDLDLAKKIVELMDDPAQREAMSKKGLDRIKTELSWPFQEKKLLQAYSSLTHTSSLSL